jgi:hypothetical protein
MTQQLREMFVFLVTDEQGIERVAGVQSPTGGELPLIACSVGPEGLRAAWTLVAEARARGYAHAMGVRCVRYVRAEELPDNRVAALIENS